MFGIFYPLPPCPNFGLLQNTKSTQPPLLLSEFGKPPLSSDVICTWPLLSSTFHYFFILDLHTVADIKDAESEAENIHLLGGEVKK